MEMSEKIASLRKQYGLTLEEVGKSVGVGKSTVRKWETGDIKNMRRDKIAKLAEALHTTPAYLMGWEDDDYTAPTITDKIVTFPVIGEVAAGYEHIAAEDWTGETVEIPESYLHGRPRSDYFVLTVCGDSMYPLYMDGDKVLVLKQNTLDRSGQIGVIRYDGDKASLKKIEFVTGEDWLRMVPVNPSYMPQEIKGPDLEKCSIIGIPQLLLREIEK